jgi:lipopolysaccharide/colanic/teichoic acid biosynthesis glycosyltransferase
LVLLDAEQIGDVELRTEVFKNIFGSLRTSVRETDTIGWQERGSTLAVLFCDISSTSKIVINTLRTRVANAIALEAAFASQIQVSIHTFPNNSTTLQGPSDRVLYPDLGNGASYRGLDHLVKRAIDVIASSILLLCLSPVLLLAGLAIKLTSKGPVIFRQQRVGQYGKPFSFLKFRSMYVNNNPAIHKEYVTKLISQNTATSENGTVYKITNDPRITRVGRFLRKTSIDELPQLWNVLRGEMSLVGPRPPLPYEMECYAVWHRRRVLEARPGITGLWQVTGRSRTSFNEMVRLDLRYVKQWSVWLDLKILLHTPKAVFMGQGAY